MCGAQLFLCKWFEGFFCRGTHAWIEENSEVSQLLCGLQGIWVSGTSTGFVYCPAAPKNQSKKQILKTWKCLSDFKIQKRNQLDVLMYSQHLHSFFSMKTSLLITKKNLKSNCARHEQRYVWLEVLSILVAKSRCLGKSYTLALFIYDTFLSTFPAVCSLATIWARPSFYICGKEFTK